MEDIPQLIPVNNNSEKPQESINIGDILEGEIILAGQSRSTGTKHKILVTHKISGTRFIGDHSGLVFEMDVKGANNEYFSLSIVHTHPRVNMYYGTFHVESIKKPLVAVVRDYGNRMVSSFVSSENRLPDIDISDTVDTNKLSEVFAHIDTTQKDVAGVIYGHDEHPSKREENLEHLGDLYVGMILSGTIERTNRKKEKMEYRIEHISATRIFLTRVVYTSDKNDIRVKRYVLSNIKLIGENEAIGELKAHGGADKGLFLFPIQKSRGFLSTYRRKISRAVKRGTIS